MKCLSNKSNTVELHVIPDSILKVYCPAFWYEYMYKSIEVLYRILSLICHEKFLGITERAKKDFKNNSLYCIHVYRIIYMYIITKRDSTVIFSGRRKTKISVELQSSNSTFWLFFELTKIPYCTHLSLNT